MQILLVSGFLGQLAMTVLLGLLLSQHEDHWLRFALLLNFLSAALYFKHLYKFVSGSILSPLAALAETVETYSASETASKSIAELDKKVKQAISESIEKERLIADQAAEVICSISDNYKFVAVNPIVYEQWGYPPAGLIGKELLRYIYQEDRQRFLQALEKCRAQGNVATENRLATSEGDLMDLEWAIEWSESSSTFFCIARNICDRKNLERAKQEFISMISHDLRSPLNAVMLVLERLELNLKERNDPDKQLFVMIDNAGRSLARVLRLIEQMLDLDRLEAGKLTLEQGEISINELFEDVYKTAEPLASKKGILIEVKGSQSRVFVDRDRMIQVLLNLLANAIKFTDSGKRVRLAAEDGPDYLLISVEDQGRGIPLANRKSIFDRFKQVRSEDASSGSGLGLPICRLLLEAHHSNLELESVEGRGSKFYFKIPRLF